MADASNVIAVIGGGLVGSMAAAYFAKRGYEVHLYESRKDIRNEPKYSGKSINLALSTRGITALQPIGLDKKIIGVSLPMKGRMIHALNGSQNPILYGTESQAILSIDRRNLNEEMLSAAETYDNVHFHFEHKLLNANPHTGELHFSTPEGEVHAKADFIVGADGAHSAARQSLIRHGGMVNYSQQYLEHGYKELTMPPSPSGGFRMSNNHLHIWPRGSFMMIALPNLDKTFTVTLFMPMDNFEAIHNKEALLAFFDRYFPDALELIGREKITEDFFGNPTGTLVTVKLSPFHAKKMVLIGDACHAMCPFYGQGMNAGFEDCYLLDSLLDKYQNNFEKVASEFTAKRDADAKAICDLALRNYIEMRDTVATRMFLVRKKIDNFLHWLFPASYIPLYTMVTFTRIPYAEVVSRDAAQHRLVDNGLMVLGAALVGTLLACGLRNRSSFFEHVVGLVSKFNK